MTNRTKKRQSGGPDSEAGRDDERKGLDSGRKEECVCLNCGTRIRHQTDMPCYTVSCPECGSKMATTKARVEDITRRA